MRAPQGDADAAAIDDVEVRLAQRGDTAALESLLRRYRPMGMARSRAYFVVGAEREDVYQEAMFGLYKAVRDFRAERGVPFRVFARLCVDRQICSAVRTSSRQKHRHLNRAVSLFSLTRNLGGADSGDEPPVLESVSDLDPLDCVLASESYEELRVAIPALLSAREAEILRLVVAGHGYLDIAGILECPAKSVDNTLQRIRRKVRAFLEERATDDEEETPLAAAGR